MPESVCVAVVVLVMFKILEQGAATARGTVKLDSGVGNVKTVVEIMLDCVQQFTAVLVV